LQKLTERVAWAIKIIATDSDLDKGITDVALAKILGTNKDTLAVYRQEGGLLKGEVIDNLVARYNFSPQWLFKGQGEPFPGARAKYPDVCGPDSAPIYNNDTLPAALGIDPAIQAMSDIKDIFASGDPVLIPAIQANINAFKRALQRERQFSQLINENRKLNESITDLRAQVEELRRQVDRLTAIPSTAIAQDDSLELATKAG